MTISSSIYTTGHAQRDGRRYVREVHTDHLGTEYVFEYLKDDATDANAVLAGRASRLAVVLAEREYRDRIEEDAWSALQHQTGAQFADRFRGEYRSSVRARCAYMAWWIIRRLAAGDFTDAAVRNSFGMTVTQYNTMKARWQALHDNWDAVIAAQGE
jgi:hypothetical protein